MSEQSFNEQQLIEGIQNSSKSVYRYLYQEMTPVIYHDIIQNSGTQEDAEDLFQEVIMMVTKNVLCGKYTAGNLKGYIRNVARNQWHKKLRKKHVEVSLDQNENDTLSNWSESSDEEEDQQIQEDKETRIRAKLARLGQSCQNLLMHFYREGMSLQEIADRQDASYKYCKKRLYECRQQLKRLIEQENEFE